jgi:hypothetical protein
MMQRITADLPSQVEIPTDAWLHALTKIRQYRFNLNALSGPDNENVGLNSVAGRAVPGYQACPYA